MDDAEADAAPAAARPNKHCQPLDLDLGARVRALRRAEGMSQTALGTAVGVSFQQMQKYETGKDRLSAATLFAIATTLNVPIGSFYGSVPQNAPVKPSKPARSGTGDVLSARIAILFQQIDDPDIRKQLLRLATALAHGRARGAPEVADGDRP